MDLKKLGLLERMKVQLPNGKVAKVTSATGMRGVLCMGADGKVFFRQYGADGSFEDYDLCHTDLSVVIEDEATLYEFEDGSKILDHSPQVLGLAVIEAR